MPLIPENCDSIQTGVVMFDQVFTSRLAFTTYLAINLLFALSRYGQIHPVFFEGDLVSAAAEARRSERLLAIYLHHDASIAANVFPAVVLCDQCVSCECCRDAYV